MKQQATFNTRDIVSWDVSIHSIMTHFRLYIPMYFDPTDKFSSLNHKKMAIYFCMSLMVEPNIVFLAQNEVIFEKMMTS